MFIYYGGVINRNIKFRSDGNQWVLSLADWGAKLKLYLETSVVEKKKKEKTSPTEILESSVCLPLVAIKSVVHE